MNKNDLIKQLAHNAERIRGLVMHIPAEQARWKPEPEVWSILEVINHLADEERLDFRVRIEYTLYRPGEVPPSIDPAGWVTRRAYNQRDLDSSLDDFLTERAQSLQWLKGLDNPNWDAPFKAPWGEICAGDFFASWVAHDLLHMRQLVELLWAYTLPQVEPYSVQYAGEW